MRKIFFLLTSFFAGLATCRRSAGSYTNVGLGSTDGGFEKDKIPRAAGDSNSRDFTYFMLGGARFVYASAVRLALIKVSTSARRKIMLFLIILSAHCIYLIFLVYSSSLCLA